ncbi:hypothetical protein KGF54_002269 [Candida jiufengensis]|uniref:uncharacterized protein n=1 Tax=Candida jiufengensis TaxID=497108 RepID=UPI002224711C|nr:uncharacterized protein KGF54_002269 [Candida jiufengensis]KAI5954494.1 hypothetical protein KGF54_002269 [Candida jiufengensis]
MESLTRQRLRYGAFGAILSLTAYKQLDSKSFTYTSSSSTSSNSSPTFAAIALFIKHHINSINHIQSIISKETLGIYKPHLSLILVFLFFNFCKWGLFGKLSSNEIINLRDKITYTIWEFFIGFILLCVRFNIDDGSKDSGNILLSQFIKFGGLFLVLLLLKCFNYLSSDRIQNLSNTTIIINRNEDMKKWAIKLSIGLIILNFIDVLLIFKFFYSLYLNGFWSNSIPNYSSIKDNILIAIFGYEVLSLFPMITLTSLKCGLELNQILKPCIEENQQDWIEYKAFIINIGEFIVNLLQFFSILLFSLVFLYFYTFPIHILPSSYLSLKVVVNKARKFVNFQKKYIVLNKKLKIPTLLNDDNCVICLDDLMIDDTTKNIREINCCHQFHYDCLKKWINYSICCPTCRKAI